MQHIISLDAERACADASLFVAAKKIFFSRREPHKRSFSWGSRTIIGSETAAAAFALSSKEQLLPEEVLMSLRDMQEHENGVEFLPEEDEEAVSVMVL